MNQITNGSPPPFLGGELREKLISLFPQKLKKDWGPYVTKRKKNKKVFRRGKPPIPEYIHHTTLPHAHHSLYEFYGDVVREI